MTRYGAVVAYDGTAYQGFQRQPAPAPTIQAALERAIAAITQQPCTIVAAGRTDSGVHARGQVIAFDLHWRHDDAKLLRAINARLPLDIALQRLWQQPGFHPRFDALWRQYTYSIRCLPTRDPLLQRQAWQLIGEELDHEPMQRAALSIIGDHDFAALGSPPQQGSSNTVRQVLRSRWTVSRGGAAHTYTIRATAFLYRMVRRLVGMLVQVGRGQLTVAAFADTIASANRRRAKWLAPPMGLVLDAVAYAPRKEQKRALQPAPCQQLGALMEGSA